MSPYDVPRPTSRALRAGLVLVTLPAVFLTLAAVGVVVVAATTRYDMGGWAGLVALMLLGGALFAAVVPALGWILRNQAPRVSAAIVLLGGVVVLVWSLQMVAGPLLGPPEGRVGALPPVLPLLLGVAILWTGARAWQDLRPRRPVEDGARV